MTADPDHLLTALEQAAIEKLNAAREERKTTQRYVILAIVSGVLLSLFLLGMLVAFKSPQPVQRFTFEGSNGDIHQCNLDSNTRVYICHIVFDQPAPQPTRP